LLLAAGRTRPAGRTWTVRTCAAHACLSLPLCPAYIHLFPLAFCCTNGGERRGYAFCACHYCPALPSAHYAGGTLRWRFQRPGILPARYSSCHVGYQTDVRFGRCSRDPSAGSLGRQAFSVLRHFLCSFQVFCSGVFDAFDRCASAHHHLLAYPTFQTLRDGCTPALRWPHALVTALWEFVGHVRCRCWCYYLRFSVPFPGTFAVWTVRRTNVITPGFSGRSIRSLCGCVTVRPSVCLRTALRRTFFWAGMTW